MSRFRDLDPESYALPESIRERLLSPVLCVYMDKVRENVRRMLAYTGSPDRWRPHIKTTKIPAVYRELVRAGVDRFKCATTREARVMLGVLREEGVSGDLLLAYPLRMPALAQLGRLAAEHPASRVSVLCEDPGLVADIPEHLSIFVDVNPGMDRTGVPLSESERLHAVIDAAGTRFRGIHYYDGHLHGPMPEREDEIHTCYSRALELVDTLKERGVATEEIITSGTPAVLHALRYDGFTNRDDLVHRVSPGTVVFHDWRSERENPGLELVPAAVLFTRVVSRPRSDLATCDTGSKAVAAEGDHACAYVLGWPGLEAQTPSEEHLPLRAVEGKTPALGTELFLVPHHVCPTVNLAEQVLLCDGDDHEPTDVTARAHDLFAV